MENDCLMTNEYIRINAYLLYDTVGGHKDSVQEASVMSMHVFWLQC